MKKHESTTQPGLFFWTEKVFAVIPSFRILSGGEGLLTTDACDEWFYNESEADLIARKLANGEDIYAGA
jgi:hypothetical protein